MSALIGSTYILQPDFYAGHEIDFSGRSVSMMHDPTISYALNEQKESLEIITLIKDVDREHDHWVDADGTGRLGSLRDYRKLKFLDVDIIAISETMDEDDDDDPHAGRIAQDLPANIENLILHFNRRVDWQTTLRNLATDWTTELHSLKTLTARVRTKYLQTVDRNSWWIFSARRA
ncbi:hypothetical protein BDV96DRAFT_561587 [Lophiotrema nucula]|uniref:Uncharacterized protein n=1 Tax=Lophiotrema nucula TaxID=690887 RepID=A0A6A5ZUE0_9PLEO|nr:hypothetical protein BDV96DRAFT_561587 [Lophiotrema nucula]